VKIILLSKDHPEECKDDAKSKYNAESRQYRVKMILSEHHPHLPLSFVYIRLRMWIDSGSHFFFTLEPKTDVRRMYFNRIKFSYFH
jgi:hypothetical protein